MSWGGLNSIDYDDGACTGQRSTPCSFWAPSLSMILKQIIPKLQNHSMSAVLPIKVTYETKRGSLAP